jgi:hypothetical protein
MSTIADPLLSAALGHSCLESLLESAKLQASQMLLDLHGDYGQFLKDFGGGLRGKYQQALTGGAARHGDCPHSYLYTTGARAGTATLHSDDYAWWNPLHAVVDVGAGHVTRICLDPAWH